jgi:ABC-type phosphate transport system substrate-binding protein
MPQPFIKNVPAISSMYLANTSLKQMQIFKERFHFGNKNGNKGLNLYINNISSAHNQLKIMQQFLKFRQHLVKVCLFLKLFSTNTLVRAAYLYVKKNNSKKIKFKKIKFYNKLLNNMFFKKQKKNDFFFV